MKDYKIQYLVENTVKNYNKRKVIIWGKSELGDIISNALFEQHGIKTDFFIDINKGLVNGTTIRSVEDIAGKSDEFFVVVPLKYHESIIEMFDQYGFLANCDYAYNFHIPITITQEDFYNGQYSDIFGNTVLGDIGEGKIILRGYNAKIKIGNSTSIEENVEFHIEDDVELVVGPNTIIKKNTKWHLGPNSIIEVGDYCKFDPDGLLTCFQNSKFMIGSNTEFRCRYWIVAHRNTSIQIGNECLFARELMMRTNDGHSIFDIHTGKNINSSMSEQHNKKINISDHVWVGARCICLYNADIGTGSVVGANSLVKKKYPNNCIIAGSPAKIIRRDIAWAKENNTENMDSINPIYLNSTMDIL